MTWLRISLAEIAARNEANGGHFFEKSTLRFFNDVPGNWCAYRFGDRVFIRNERHRHGRGMFSGCTLRGQVREVFENGDIGPSLPELAGMTPRGIASALAENPNIGRVEA